MKSIQKKSPETSTEEAPDNAAGPRSLMRVLNLFDAIAKSADGMTLAELSSALACPKSSLLALLRPLVANGYLEHAEGRYGLGHAIFQLSADIMASQSFPKVVRHYMEDLMLRGGETVYLVALDRGTRQVTYLEMVESRAAVRYAVPAGTVRPLFVSSAGRVLLAFQDEAWREQYIKSTKMVQPLTGEVIYKAWLRQELKRVREEGVAVSIGESVPGAAGIAAPILLADGTATHCLLIAGPTDRCQQELPRLKELIREVTGKMSVALRDVRG